MAGSKRNMSERECRKFFFDLFNGLVEFVGRTRTNTGSELRIIKTWKCLDRARSNYEMVNKYTDPETGPARVQRAWKHLRGIQDIPHLIDVPEEENGKAAYMENRAKDHISDLIDFCILSGQESIIVKCDLKKGTVIRTKTMIYTAGGGKKR